MYLGRRKFYFLLFFVIIIAIMVIFFVFYFVPTRNHIHSITRVKFVYPKLLNKVESIKAHGSIISRETVKVQSQEDGRIIKVNIQDGQKVQDGEVLFQLDDRKAGARMNESEAAYELNKLTYARQFKLYKKHFVSKQKKDTDYAELKESKAIYQQNKVVYEDTKITAPISGQVGKVDFVPGDFIKKGDILTKLVNLSDLQVQYSLPQASSLKIKLGQIVWICLDSLAKRHFKAQVVFISPEVNELTRTITVRAKLINMD